MALHCRHIGFTVYCLLELARRILNAVNVHLALLFKLPFPFIHASSDENALLLRELLVLLEPPFPKVLRVLGRSGSW